MNDSRNKSLKRNKNRSIENKINMKSSSKKGNYFKNQNPMFLNNKSSIKLIDFLNNNNTNYKNIILNNMISPNKAKKILFSNKSTSKDKINLKLKSNILFNHDKSPSIYKNQNLKTTINNQEIEAYDMETRYKLIITEKNNLINKLKNEVEYYKNYYRNINMNMNIILPNNNTIETSNKRKYNDSARTKSKSKDFFTLLNTDKNLEKNHLLQDFNRLKTYVDNINFQKKYSNDETSDKKLILSNDALNRSNNIFYRSNSNKNSKVGRKIKLGLMPSELNLNYNSIDANKNYKIPVKTSNLVRTHKESDDSDNRMKNDCYSNNISFSPSNIINKESLYKTENKFDYKDNLEKLKNRMNNLVHGLFNIIEMQNKK